MTSRATQGEPRILRSDAPATVLVADDNAAKRYIVQRWLQESGYSVIEATTGEEALLRASEQPDLVILDVRLPDMSGFEVLRRLKSHPRTATIPVLHLSAHVTSSEDRVTGLEQGADGYLTHPVEPTELVATVRALLRIRRAEAALRQSEERYRLVARATNDVIWDWDLRTNEVLWNDAAAILFRRPREEIQPTARWWYETIHPDDRARVVAGMHAVIDGNGELWTDEYRMLRGDGSYATVYDRGFVTHDERGHPLRMIGSMLDVTERKHSEESKQLLADASSALAASLDPRATLRQFAHFVVPRLAEVCAVYLCEEDDGVSCLETTAADIATEQRLAAELGPVSRGESAPVIERVLGRVLRSGSSVLLDAQRGASDIAFADALRRRAGAERRQGGSPGADGDGQASHGDQRRASDADAALLAVLGVSSALIMPLRAHDHVVGAVVLGRRVMTRFGISDFALLEELVGRAAMAVDNAQLYEKALVANRAKADFLAVMSHELRTPLNAIVGYSDLLLLGIPKPLTTEGQAYVDRVQAAARHLLQLIEQILIFSRMEAGREHAHLEAVQIGDVARDTAALIEPLAREKGLRFELAVAPEAELVVRTDPQKVRQILLNLLSNAVKFTDAGRVRMTITADAEGVTCEVVDSGIGIPASYLEKVFEPFWQVEQDKKRRAGGSGLGLSVSRRLARLLGGELTVDSRVGDGSRFVLRLPRG